VTVTASMLAVFQASGRIFTAMFRRAIPRPGAVGTPDAADYDPGSPAGPADPPGDP
jgi:hypothetical protein